jgi:thioredoxin reductase
MFDLIIVGGSTAGLTAALTLGRFRRKVLVLDSGQPANRFSHASHNFFTRDGVPPTELLAIAREQLAAYPSVTFRSIAAESITGQDGAFRVRLADGSEAQGRKILLATGLKDSFPHLEGAEQFWGKGLYHCPYCDGWEQRDKRIVIIGDATPSPRWPLLAHLLHRLSDQVTFCTNGHGEISLTPEDRASFAAHNITVIDIPVQGLGGHDGILDHILLADGQRVPCESVFTHPLSVQQASLAESLGCALSDAGFVLIDDKGQTNVPGVYAAGDTTTPMRQLVQASYQGSVAAANINMTLLMEDLA